MEKNNEKRNRYREKIVNDLLLLEDEIADNIDANGKFIDGFQSDYIYKDRKALYEMLNAEFDAKSSYSYEIINEMLGQEIKGRKPKKAVIYYDERNKCFRISQKRKPDVAHDLGLRYTMLPAKSQCYIEFTNDNAYTAANLLSRYFSKNDIRIYALTPSLLLCIDLEVPEYSEIVAQDNLEDAIYNALDKLGYTERPYSNSQDTINGYTADDLEEERLSSLVEKQIQKEIASGVRKPDGKIVNPVAKKKLPKRTILPKEKNRRKHI